MREDKVGVKVLGRARHNTEAIVQGGRILTRLDHMDIIEANRLTRQVEGGIGFIVAIVSEGCGPDCSTCGIGERHLHIRREARTREHQRHAAGITTLLGTDLPEFERQNVGTDNHLLAGSCGSSALEINTIVTGLGGGDIEFGVVCKLINRSEIISKRTANRVVGHIQHIDGTAGFICRLEMDADGFISIGVDVKFIIVHQVIVEHIVHRGVERQITHGQRERIGRAGSVVVIVDLIEHVAHISLDNDVVLPFRQTRDAGRQMLLNIVTRDDIDIVAADTAQQAVVGIEHHVGREVDQAAQTIARESIATNILHRP